MSDRYRIFTLSPGSTSTKLALFEGEDMIFKANVTHAPEILAGYANVNDQLPYRLETIQREFQSAGIDLAGVDAFSAYSGGLESMEGGVYPVNDMILLHSREGRTVKHPAILGAQLIDLLSKEYGGKAFLVNPPDVDEFDDYARLTGIKGLYRESRVHVLNQKEVAMRYAAELEKPYAACNLVVAHVGGGLSVTAHRRGRMVDGNDVLSGDGPMAPNRSGSVPAVPIIRMCFSGAYTQEEMIGKISKTGGLISHLGTDNTREIKDRMEEGDWYARLVYEGMAYQLAKAIGSYAVVLKGHVDGIVLTGGVSHDVEFVQSIRDWCGWIAPVKAYGGDFEMEALAAGVTRVLRGEEAAKEYTGIPVWSGFEKT